MKRLLLISYCVLCFFCTHAQTQISVSAGAQRIIGKEIQVVKYSGMEIDSIYSFLLSDTTVKFSIPKSGFYRFCFSNTFSFPLFLNDKAISMVISGADFPESINETDNKTFLRMLKKEREIMRTHYPIKGGKPDNLLLCKSMIEKEIKAIENPTISAYLLAEYYTNPYFFRFPDIDIVQHKNELNSFLENKYAALSDTDALRLFSVRFSMLNIFLANSRDEWIKMNKKDYKLWSQNGIINENNKHFMDPKLKTIRF